LLARIEPHPAAQGKRLDRRKKARAFRPSSIYLVCLVWEKG